MHDFRVNIKRQEIVLIVAHQPTGAEQLLNKLSPSSSGAAALGFFFFFSSKGAQQSGVRGGWWGAPVAPGAPHCPCFDKIQPVGDYTPPRPALSPETRALNHLIAAAV